MSGSLDCLDRQQVAFQGGKWEWWSTESYSTFGIVFPSRRTFTQYLGGERSVIARRGVWGMKKRSFCNCYHLPASESYLLIGTPGKKVVAIAPDWMKSLGWARMGKQNWNKGWQKEKFSRGICQHITYSFEAEKNQACNIACCSFFTLCHPWTEHSFI